MIDPPRRYQYGVALKRAKGGWKVMPRFPTHRGGEADKGSLRLMAEQEDTAAITWSASCTMAR
ncbi:MAG TPA: hypothetical protein VGI22_10885 [Xanthobacteraceae bacterium]